MSDSRWIPEIMYEESEDGLTSKIPFIQVPETEEMPGILFVFESRETGEFEPGPDGEEMPVTELDLHQYANMATLKEKLISCFKLNAQIACVRSFVFIRLFCSLRVKNLLHLILCFVALLF